MKTREEFCVIFPEALGNHILPLRSKCDQLGITKKKEDKRTKFFFSEHKSDQDFSITEKELKTWINQQGTYTFLEESSEEYQNWERLLYSKHPQSIILAITIINKDYRPVPKLFSLWLILTLFYQEKSVKSAAKMMILQYLEQKEIPDVKIGGLSFTKNYFINHANIFHQYYDLNYLHFWATKLIEHYPYSESILRFSSKNIHKIFEIENQSVFFHKIVSIEIKLEPNDSLDFLEILVDRCTKLNEIKIHSDEIYPIKPKELKSFNIRHLFLKKCILPSYISSAPILDKVKSLFLIGEDDINYSDWLFPNLTRLKLEGAKIKKLNLTKNLLSITSFSLCLTKQKSLPNQLYEMIKLRFLQINCSSIVKVSQKINKLENLKIINLSVTKFPLFPVEFMLAPNLQDIIDLKLPQDYQLQLDKYPNSLAVDSLSWAKSKTIKYFPYEFHIVGKLRYIDLQFQLISKIDSRIAKFKTLEELSLKQNNFHYLPDALRQLPNLNILDLSINNIKTISFEWIKHAYEKTINLNLKDNPITFLPAIPDGFQPNNTPNHGKIILTKEKLEITQLINYQELFGQNFITLV